MLNAIVSLLKPTLISVVGKKVTLLNHMAESPALDSASIGVFATKLINTEANNYHVNTPVQRDAVYATQYLTLKQSKADPLNFQLPTTAIGRVIEVLTPDGRLLARGNAYELDGDWLRFYNDPGTNLQVGLRDQALRGYTEINPAKLTLCLSVTAPDEQQADKLLSQTLLATLAFFSERDVLPLYTSERLKADSTGLIVRLLKPKAHLDSVTSSIVADANAQAYRLQAEVLVTAQLITALQMGTTEALGYIEAININATSNPS